MSRRRVREPQPVQCVGCVWMWLDEAVPPMFVRAEQVPATGDGLAGVNVYVSSATRTVLADPDAWSAYYALAPTWSDGGHALVGPEFVKAATLAGVRRTLGAA